MTDEIAFLNEDLPNPEQAAVEVETQNPEVGNTFVTPTWEDVKSGKVNYRELNPSLRAKVKLEAYEETPDDKKYLWDEYKFTPPETYGGLDKSGRKVDALDLEGFEELVKKGKIPKKTKVEQDVEHLTNLVKETNKTLLSRDERDLDKKISELKEAGLSSPEEFENYEKMLTEKQDIKFQKLQLEKDVPKKEEVKQQVDVSSQFSLDEQVAIEVFRNNSENKVFIELMSKSKEMSEEFDRTAFALRNKNPNASLDQIATASKIIIENKFNLNKQQRPMSRNIIQSEQKTNLNSQPTQKLTYNMLDERAKKWVRSEAVSGKSKYSGKNYDEITHMVYGEVYKQMLTQKK